MDFDTVKEAVCEMIADAKDLDADDLGADVVLNTLELESLDFVELMVMAKRKFGIQLTAEVFQANPEMTIGQLCQYIVDHAEAK